jgi:hypothetical protein
MAEYGGKPGLIPASGYFDANDTSARSLPTAADVQEAILSGGPEDAPTQLVIANLGIWEPLNLSFKTVHTRVIFRNCALNGGLVATRANLAGLELYDVTVHRIDLDWARVDGDIRLVRVNPPQPRTRINVEDPTTPQQQPPLEPHTHVSAVGAVITGEVSIAGSNVTEADADALQGCRRRDPGAASTQGGTFNWDLLLQAVGLAAALTAWVAVVGGATLWARMESIDAPALPTLAALGQAWMVTAGLQTLLVPLLLGAAVALFVYFSRWDPTFPEHDAPREQRDDPPDLGSARLAARRASVLRRARPVVAVRRLHRSTRRFAVLVFAILGWLFGAALYVAQASWEVLVATLILLAVSLLAVAFRGTEGKERARSGFVFVVTALVAGGSVAAVFAAGPGQAPWFPVAASVGVACAVIAVILVRIGAAVEPATFGWLLMAVAISGLFLSLLVTVTIGWLVFMAAATVLTLWVSLGALVDRSPRAAAVTVFIALVVWSGTLQYAREIGVRTPTFPAAQVTLTDGSEPSGLLVGRTSEIVLIADNDPKNEGEPRTVTAIPTDRIQEVVYGNEIKPAKPEDDNGSNDSNGGSGEEDDDKSWWDSLDWNWGFLVPGGAGGTADTGTDDGTPDNDQVVVVQPKYQRVAQDPFQASPTIAVTDAEVDGVPVRLGLLGIQRSDNVFHLWMRVINMDHQSAHTAADMLSLPNGELDTPTLIDPAAERAYAVSETASTCDCSVALEAVTLDPFEQLDVYAEYVVPHDVGKVDITVPAFGTFRDVDVE